MAVILSILVFPGSHLLRGMSCIQSSFLTQSSVANMCPQPHRKRGCDPLHGPRYISYNYHAENQGHYYGVYTFLPRCHFELCRVGYHLFAFVPRYLAGPDEGEEIWKAGHVWRRHMAQTIP